MATLHQSNKKSYQKKNHHDGTNELKWQWSTPKKILQSEENKRSQCNAKKNLNQPSVNHRTIIEQEIGLVLSMRKISFKLHRINLPVRPEFLCTY